MQKYLTVAFATLCCCYSAFSQDTRLSLSPEINIPLGKMAWSYKPGIGTQLGFSYVDNGGDVLKAYGVSISYTSLAPQADTLYYVMDDGGTGGASIGKAAYSAFKIFHLKATLDWAFPVSKKMTFTLSASAGIIYGNRSIYFDDSSGTNDLGDMGAWATLNPAAGIEFIVSESFSVVPYVSYTFMLQTGSTDANSYNYNPSTGSTYHFFTPGISINYNF